MSNENHTKEFPNSQRHFTFPHNTPTSMFYTLKQTFEVAKIEKLH